MREFSDTIPKPMVNIGYRPILWHIMKYYAHYGHKDFILCLGHGADLIKNYFLNYNECISNDFVLSQGGKNLRLFNSDIDDWNITFADTGTSSNIGQRLKAVEKYLEGEDVFLANYSDGLTDLPLNDQINHFKREQKVASFLCVKPNLSCHFITLNPEGVVEAIKDVSRSDIRINGGYFVFRKDIFEYMNDGEELLHEPFQRLVEQEAATRLQVRRLLGGHGYLQGQADARRHLRERPCAVASLEPFISGTTLRLDQPNQRIAWWSAVERLNTSRA